MPPLQPLGYSDYIDHIRPAGEETMIRAHPPITRETRWAASEDIRCYFDDLGGIVLNVRTGKFLGINESGSLILAKILEEGTSTTHSLVSQIFTGAPSVNDEPMFRTAQDIEEFVLGLESSGLIRRGTGLPQLNKRQVAQSERSHILSRGPQPHCKWHVHLLYAIVSLFLIMLIRLAKMFTGFAGMRRIVKHFPVFTIFTPLDICPEHLSVALDRAARFVLSKARCLERAAVLAMALRFFGMQASMLIGLRRVPFYSHAWVEIDGVPFNEVAALQAQLTVLDRF